MVDIHEVFTRFTVAVNTMDLETLAAMIHPDYMCDFPQSGERLRGWPAFRAQLEGYPGGLATGRADSSNARLVRDEPRWVITPGYTVLPLDAPERFTAIMRTQYPDGTFWHVINIIELRDGLVWRAITYFAPEFEAPEWRSGITERYDRSNP